MFDNTMIIMKNPVTGIMYTYIGLVEIDSSDSISCLLMTDRVDPLVCPSVFQDEISVYTLSLTLNEIDKGVVVLKNNRIVDSCSWELMYCEINLNIVVISFVVVLISTGLLAISAAAIKFKLNVVYIKYTQRRSEIFQDNLILLFF